MGRHSLPEQTVATSVDAPTLTMSEQYLPSPRRATASGALPVVSPVIMRGLRPLPTDPTAIAVTGEPRLLAGRTGDRSPAGLDHHLEIHGPLPPAQLFGRQVGLRLIELVKMAGLRGRGGAGFPTAVKMATVSDAAKAKRLPVVVANGCEGDPTSGKDGLLLHLAPHLVLDGIELAVRAVGADEAMLCVHRGDPVGEALERAIAERRDDPVAVTLVRVPARYVSSESSALTNFLTTGDARPTNGPPRPSQRGVHGRPTLVDNVETLAHLALIARHGPDWFRARGTESSPGTTLVTMGGAVCEPGVYEVDLGAPIGELLRLAGGTTGPTHGLLLGGLGGSWLPMPSAVDLGFSHEAAQSQDLRLGVASLVALPESACGVATTALLLRHLAGESAGQCGPCMFGLRAIAEDLETAAAGQMDPQLHDRLRKRLDVIPERGACAHPDGAVQLATSALEVFRRDLTNHLYGRPCGAPDTAIPSVLRELPAQDGVGWR
jgi:NADH:ubiquinone oxidoreductase subunit F (NADH-binding)